MSNNELIKLDGVGTILSKICNKLIENKTLMRCLFYTSSDALSPSLPDVTPLQIKDLCGKGNDPINDQRFYKYEFYDGIKTDTSTELRVFIPIIKPEGIYLSELNICFQIIIHNTKLEIDDNKLKSLIMVNEILKDLNGKDGCGGIGSLKLISPIIHKPWSSNFSGYYFFLNTRSR